MYIQCVYYETKISSFILFLVVLQQSVLVRMYKKIWLYESKIWIQYLNVFKGDSQYPIQPIKNIFR